MRLKVERNLVHKFRRPGVHPSPKDCHLSKANSLLMMEACFEILNNFVDSCFKFISNKDLCWNGCNYEPENEPLLDPRGLFVEVCIPNSRILDSDAFDVKRKKLFLKGS